MAYNIVVNISVSERYNSTSVHTINKTITVENFEQVARIIGKLVSHIPESK